MSDLPAALHSDTDALHSEIKVFLAETGMGPTYFGQLAAKNATLVSRLELGRTVTLVTAARVRAFMKDYRSKHSVSPQEMRGGESSAA